MPEPTLNLTIAERIEAARTEVRRAVAHDAVMSIHPFDLYFLLQNPTVNDVVLINLFDRQFMVIDGGVYETTVSVKNIHTITEVMNRKPVAVPPSSDQAS